MEDFLNVDPRKRVQAAICGNGGSWEGCDMNVVGYDVGNEKVKFLVRF